jgi:hypothetical protein
MTRTNTSGTDVALQLVGTFSDWTKRLEVYAELLRALGEFKLKSAQAELAFAQTVQLYQQIQTRQIMIEQLQRALWRLNREEARLAKQVWRIDQRRRRVSMWVSGGRLAVQSWGRVINAYHWFATQSLLEAGESLFAVKLPAEARQADQYQNSIDPSSGTIDAPASITSVLGLVEWLLDQRYQLRAGTAAQRAVMELLRAMNAPAKMAVDRMQRELEDLRRGTYDTWKPLVILGVEESSVAREIKETGTRLSN